MSSDGQASFSELKKFLPSLRLQVRKLSSGGPAILLELPEGDRSLALLSSSGPAILPGSPIWDRSSKLLSRSGPATLLGFHILDSVQFLGDSYMLLTKYVQEWQPLL
jgi:hypothetical protein